MNPEINAEIQELKHEIDRLRYLIIEANELSNEEMDLIPIVVHSFRHYKKNDPLKYGKIVKTINENIKKHHMNISMSHDGIMRLVNYVLFSGIIPMMCDNNGIYVMESKDDIRNRIITLSKIKDKLEFSIKKLSNNL